MHTCIYVGSHTHIHPTHTHTHTAGTHTRKLFYCFRFLSYLGNFVIDQIQLLLCFGEFIFKFMAYYGKFMALVNILIVHEFMLGFFFMAYLFAI